jgi:all-beta uncharacterized protein
MIVRCCGVLFALFFLLDARPALAQCTYSVSPASISAPSTGSFGSVSITTGSSCTWTAVSSVSWVTFTSPASGQGLSSVSYSVAPNTTGASRSGTITVAGRTITVSQSGGSCSYTVSPTSVSAQSTGLNASVSIVTGSSCPWTAVPSVTWITITSSASGSGLGSFNYSVAPNTTSVPRTGTIAVAGQTVSITQAAGSCTYTVTPTNVSVPSTGSNASVSVVTGSSCAWTATSNVSWITITAGSSMSGLGSVDYTVAVNSGAARSGTMTIAGQTVTVSQASGSCTYSVSPTNVSVPSTGSNNSIAVTTGSSCAWTATSNVAWITITAGSSMSGLGSVDYTVATNTLGVARTGTMTIAGQTVVVTQAASSCTYSVSPLSVSVPSTGSNGSIAVTTGSSCPWTSVSSVGWITVTSGASMTGLGSTDYSVAPNTTGASRTGTLTVAGRAVTFTQAAASCSYSVSPTTVSVPSTGSNGSVAVTTGSSCPWTSTSAVSWITVTAGASMSGLGSTNYSVAANTAGVARTGTLTVAGQTVTITQAAASCSYSVSPTTVSVPSTGSNGSVAVTTGSSCPWTSTSAVSWITITSGGSMSGQGSTNYTVDRNPTASTRSGTLTVAGRTVTITQNAATPPAAPTGFRVVGQ